MAATLGLIGIGMNCSGTLCTPCTPCTLCTLGMNCSGTRAKERKGGWTRGGMAGLLGNPELEAGNLDPEKREKKDGGWAGAEAGRGLELGNWSGLKPNLLVWKGNEAGCRGCGGC